MPRLVSKYILPKRLTNELKKCEKCRLSKTRHKVVIGKGTFPADILFLGEAPGESEDLFGVPFCGRSGKLLDEMLMDASQNKKMSYYITNSVLCRPCDFVNDKNRAPKKDELEACRENVLSILSFVKPKVVAFVGRVAERSLKKYFKDIKTFYVRHPASLLREGGKSSVNYFETLQTIIDVVNEVDNAKIKKAKFY